MPKITVEGYGTFEVPADKRLVLAVEQDANVDIMHACGGNARCTTCRVEFIEGEPSKMTVAQHPMFVTASSVEPTRRFLQGPTWPAIPAAIGES